MMPGRSGITTVVSPDALALALSEPPTLLAVESDRSFKSGQLRVCIAEQHRFLLFIDVHSLLDRPPHQEQAVVLGLKLSQSSLDDFSHFVRVKTLVFDRHRNPLERRIEAAYSGGTAVNGGPTRAGLALRASLNYFLAST